MAFNGSSVLIDGTITPSAGTSTAYATKGNTLNKHNLFLDNNAILLDQIELVIGIKEPKVAAVAPNGYTQARSWARLLYPINLDNGARSVNSLYTELATDVETTDAEKLSMLVNMVQLMSTAAFMQLWYNQAVA